MLWLISLGLVWGLNLLLLYLLAYFFCMVSLACVCKEIVFWLPIADN